MTRGRPFAWAIQAFGILRRDSVNQSGYLIGESFREFLPRLIELRDSGGLQIAVPAIDIQHLDGMCDGPARAGNHLGGTRQLAAVDGDRGGSGQRLLHFFVSKNHERKRHKPGASGTEVFGDYVRAFARDAPVGLANAAAGYDQGFARHFFSSASACSFNRSR